MISENKTEYTIERKYLSKISIEEFISRVIRAHLKGGS